MLTYYKAWFVASFLPLPPKSAASSVKGKNVAPRTQFEEDLEKQLSPIDEARYENARWWRNINRILSAFGIFIIIAIVSLTRTLCRIPLADRILDRTRSSCCQIASTPYYTTERPEPFSRLEQIFLTTYKVNERQPSVTLPTYTT